MNTPDLSRYYWKNPLIELRPAAPDDWERHFNSFYDSESRFLLDGELELPPDRDLAREAWQAFINPKTNNGRTVFTILNADGRAAGCVNLNSVDERNGVFSIGVQIDVTERGKGLGAASLIMLGGYAFNERRLHKWNSGYVKGNAASEAMHKKLGFKIEGVIRECIYHNGVYWDEIKCGLTAEEFNEKFTPHIL